MLIRPFQLSDEEAVVVLWRQCGLIRPVNDPRKDIRRKMRVNPELFLVGILDARLIASAMVGYDGHRGWINYLGVHPDYQRKGYARKMMEEAERLLRQRGCPKINLQVVASNHKVIEFYQRIGFAVDQVMSMGKRLEED